MHTSGAILHQIGSLSFAHQFWAKFEAERLKTGQHGGICRRHFLRRPFDTQLNVTTILRMVHAGQAEHLHARVLGLDRAGRAETIASSKNGGRPVPAASSSRKITPGTATTYIENGAIGTLPSGSRTNRRARPRRSGQAVEARLLKQEDMRSSLLRKPSSSLPKGNRRMLSKQQLSTKPRPVKA